MQKIGKTSRFFLCANTPQGFMDNFDQLYSVREGWKAYILMGAPGAGAPELLKRAGVAFESAGLPVEYIMNSLGTNDLDAISIKERKVCLVDGAAPHYLIPEYPGISEVAVNLGECWDENKLASFKDKILTFSTRIHSSCDRTYRFLSAAGSLFSDNFRMAYDCIDNDKLEKYALHLSKREFTLNGSQGRSFKRFLTALTPAGVQNLFDGISRDYSRVFVIDDDFGMARILLGKLKDYALQAGWDVIYCPCPMFPNGNPEHLLIPGLALAFISSNRFHRYEGTATRRIHMRRFINSAFLKLKRPRISFNRRASKELIDEATLLLKDVQANYDMLRSCYLQSMDFDAVNKKADELVAKILKKA